MATKLIN